MEKWDYPPMLTHEQIWTAIDRLASTNGYSPSGLAKHAGLDPTSFNKSKRMSPDGKPRWPSTESISKILNVTDVTMQNFISLIDNDGSFDKEAIAKTTAKILLDTKSVLFNAREPFTLKSGRQSPVYIDCRRLVSFVEERTTLMNAAAQVLSNEIGVENIDYVAGGETAGIPYGAFIADRLERSMLYVRKEPKGYGRMAQIEGHMEETMDNGDKPNVVLIEDLQTDGGSKKIFIDALREAGAMVEHAFVVFHYGIFDASEKNMASVFMRSPHGGMCWRWQRSKITLMPTLWMRSNPSLTIQTVGRRSP
jgi:orotate phosphoribosyltransferase